MRAIEDEERLDGEGEQAQKAIIEGSERWVFAALTRLDLKLPDRYINCKAEWFARLLNVFHGQFREGDSFAGAELLIDAVKLLVQ